jgi:(p)ppGpp synthase/HD superfamily hydrolase
MDGFKKRLLTLRATLIGAGYANALIALEFAHQHHTGLRRDGVTPEFDHQISIALHALTLPDLIHREETIAAIFLHDTPEDYDVSFDELRGIFPCTAFAGLVVPAVEAMTKTFRGIKKDETALIAAMAFDPIASIAKPCDRSHNLGTMVGVFTYEKQVSYCDDVDTKILPMMKGARRRFPHQVQAYENLKHMLKSQVQLIRAIHAAALPVAA